MLRGMIRYDDCTLPRYHLRLNLFVTLFAMFVSYHFFFVIHNYMGSCTVIYGTILCDDYVVLTYVSHIVPCN